MQQRLQGYFIHPNGSLEKRTLTPGVSSMYQVEMDIVHGTGSMVEVVYNAGKTLCGWHLVKLPTTQVNVRASQVFSAHSGTTFTGSVFCLKMTPDGMFESISDETIFPPFTQPPALDVPPPPSEESLAAPPISIPSLVEELPSSPAPQPQPLPTPALVECPTATIQNTDTMDMPVDTLSSSKRKERKRRDSKPVDSNSTLRKSERTRKAVNRYSPY